MKKEFIVGIIVLLVLALIVHAVLKTLFSPFFGLLIVGAGCWFHGYVSGRRSEAHE